MNPVEIGYGKPPEESFCYPHAWLSLDDLSIWKRTADDDWMRVAEAPAGWWPQMAVLALRALIASVDGIGEDMRDLDLRRNGRLP